MYDASSEGRKISLWDDVFRSQYGRLLSSLMTHANDIQLAEDALQEAFIQAMETWSDKNQPDNKRAWLLTVARRRLIDRFRRDSFLHDKLHNNEATIQAITDCLHQDADVDVESDHPIPDERLKLIFTCCHPALSQEARIALTLKTLCGLSAKEIARAFLVSETTMNQRLTRAKRKIKQAGIAYTIPGKAALPERLPSVLSVIYLIYNESYSAFEGQTLTRNDLAREAIRLAYILRHLLPRPDVSGLLALLLFHDSRREARSSHRQPFIPLQEQDRSCWDQELIVKARKILVAALAQGEPDTYQIQAAISALHSEAPCWEETDWQQIELLYGVLYQIEPSPVVLLNKSVAVAHSGRTQEAFTTIASLQEQLQEYQPYYVARAHVATQLGDNDLAIQDYEKAIGLSKNLIERDYLTSQREQLLKQPTEK